MRMALDGVSAMQTWLFDLGNTRLKFAPLRAEGAHGEGALGEIVAIAHDGLALPEGWDAALPARFESAVLTSVAAPGLRVALLDALSARCSLLSIARTMSRCGDLRIAYPQPEALGTDRFLAMLGARARGPGPWLVVGVGTALTIDLLDLDGRHHGGRIAPSPALMREALHARAAQLPPTGGAFVDFAADTVDALRSGCDGAALGLIAQARRDAESRLGMAPTLLLHGGGAGILADTDTASSATASLSRAVRAPALVLEGLAAWARMSQ